MTDISNLNLSNQLVLKLKEKNIETLSEVESKVCNALVNGSNVITDCSISAVSYIAPFVKKLESKKLKPTRKPKMIVVIENKEACDNIIGEIRSLITKEMVIVPCHKDVKLKKNKKSFDGPLDIIVGTTERLNELIESSVLKTKDVKNVAILNFSELATEGVEKILSSLVKSDVDASANESMESKPLQMVVTTSTFDESLKTFMGKNTNESYECIELVSTSESEENSDNESEEDSDEESEEVKEKKVEESEDSDKETEEKMEVEDKEESEEVDEEIMNKLREVEVTEKFDDFAKLIIEEFTDVDSIARLLSLLSSKKSNSVAPAAKKSTPVHTGSGSKLTGREGYTAYHFVADKEITSKGYLFKSLKRLIDEEAVEKIEQISHTKDLFGFVFDLPCELDETFQGSWRDGKYDSMSLLEGEIPELGEAPERNSFGGGRGRGDRGSFRGGDRGSFRGGDRGSFRGRGGNDRGGRGRGGDRGGYKRPGSFEGGSNPKIQKFE